MTDLTFSNISVLDAALTAWRKTGDRRYTDEQYDELAAKLAALGNQALAREDGQIHPEITDVSTVRETLDGLAHGNSTVRAVSDALIALDRIAATLRAAA